MQRFGFSIVLILFLLITRGAARAQEATTTPTVTPSVLFAASASVAASGTVSVPNLSIRSPEPGQALQGSVNILGNTAVPGFISAELAFAYASSANNPAKTWFLIIEMDQPVSDGTLAQWDTNTITDGNYDLRLRVKRQDGSQDEAIVSGVRVRNYTPVETDTPTPVTPTATTVPGNTPVPSSTPTSPAKPTPTPLPTNPAEITSADVSASLGKGALAILGLFALMGIYALVKGIGNREK